MYDFLMYNLRTMPDGLFFLFGIYTIRFYCPNEEAAMGIIVVSLPCTTYLWATLITFYVLKWQCPYTFFP